jgi:flagellar biosynthesis/type III secretory pathway protein FliH
MVLVRSRTQHEYALCQDEDCPRFPCRVYKEGWQAGYVTGRAVGYAEGYEAGYADGYADGASSSR